MISRVVVVGLGSYACSRKVMKQDFRFVLCAVGTHESHFVLLVELSGFAVFVNNNPAFIRSAGMGICCAFITMRHRVLPHYFFIDIQHLFSYSRFIPADIFIRIVR